MVGNIIHPTLMILVDILVSIYSALKTKTLTLTKVRRLNSKCNMELTLRGFAVIAEANISVPL
jgi:hypothetical protein